MFLELNFPVYFHRMEMPVWVSRMIAETRLRYRWEQAMREGASGEIWNGTVASEPAKG